MTRPIIFCTGSFFRYCMGIGIVLLISLYLLTHFSYPSSFWMSLLMRSARWNVVWHAIQINKRDLNLTEVSVCCVFFSALLIYTSAWLLCCGCITSQFGMRRIQSIMMTMWELFKCTIQASPATKVRLKKSNV